MRPWNTSLATTLFVLAGATSPALAETVLEGGMDGVAVGSDSSATGEISLVLNDAQDAVNYVISYTGLVGEEIASHIHTAPPGSFGRIVLELPAGNPKEGTWDIPAVMVPQLLAGNIYVVIHTDAYPAGEIGGWVSIVTTLAETSSWSAIRTLYR